MRSPFGIHGTVFITEGESPVHGVQLAGPGSPFWFKANFWLSPGKWNLFRSGKRMFAFEPETIITSQRVRRDPDRRCGTVCAVRQWSFSAGARSTASAATELRSIIHPSPSSHKKKGNRQPSLIAQKNCCFFETV